jgi:hypothetical protein
MVRLWLTHIVLYLLPKPRHSPNLIREHELLLLKEFGSTDKDRTRGRLRAMPPLPPF